jgi:uncharacterized membrane protein YcaP (DUF421 family)
MIFDSAIGDAFARGAIMAIAALIWIVLLVRLVGLRSLSKMTNFDFVTTIAMGSLVATASQSTNWLAFAQSFSAIAGLFVIQFTLASLRQRFDRVEGLIENQPMLLMHDGQAIESALKQTRVSRRDLLSKLREANVLDMSQVRAVVLEATGELSVLHGDRLGKTLLSGVQTAG